MIFSTNTITFNRGFGPWLGLRQGPNVLTTMTINMPFKNNKHKE
jgi:hypothetical protein